MATPETFQPEEQVQSFLDRLEPGETFVVNFVKQNGEPRRLVGQLDPRAQSRKRAVPVWVEGEGWKSFLINRVIHIGRSEENVAAKQGKG